MTDEDENEELWQPENPTDFKIYDVPTDLKNDYISMAKLQYDDEVWRVMADAMAALKEDKFTRVQILEERVAMLEEELAMLKERLKEKNKKKENDLKPTFGGGD